MSDLKRRVDISASFYNKSFLSIDYQLADFSYQTLRQFFYGRLALELGPASGYMTKHLIHDFKSLHLVEGSLDLLDQIPQYENVVKHHSLFEEFETALKFDTIIMSHVLEHVASPEIVLNKISNWLDSDGIFLISVPNAKSIHRLVAVQMGLLANEYTLNERDRELGHYRVYDLDALKMHVTNAGFKIIESGGYFLKPVSNSQIENNWSQQMIDGFYKVGKVLPEFCAEIFVACKK